MSLTKYVGMVVCHLRFAILAILAVTIIASDALAQDQQVVNKYLDELESSHYHLWLGQFSDSGGVEFGASNLPEVKYLIEHTAEAIPIMLQRLNSGRTVPSYSLVLYFIVFAKTRDSRTIPVIADYFDALPENAGGEEQLLAKYNDSHDPYPYAIAYAKIMGALPPMTSDRTFAGLYRARHEIATELRAEYKRTASSAK